MNKHAGHQDLIAVARRRLTWQRRLEWAVQGLVWGSAGIVLVVLWRAAVDLAFPWERVGVLVAVTGAAPFLVYGWRARVAPETAAGYLDRKLRAEGRVLTLLDIDGRAGHETAFEPQLLREMSALASRPWKPSWRKLHRWLVTLAAVAAVAALLLALAPAPPGEPSRVPLGAAELAALQRENARRLGEWLRAGGEKGLADRLDQVVQDGVRTPVEAREAERLAGALEERLYRHELRAALQAALGETPPGQKLLAVLVGPGGRGVSLLDQAEETTDLLENAARFPTLPPRLEKLLQDVRSAIQNRDAGALQAAVETSQSLLGGEGSVSPETLAEAAELLAAMQSGTGPRPRTTVGSHGSVRVPKMSGPGGHPGVRGEENGVTVRDPNLRRVIRRYFTSDHGKK